VAQANIPEPVPKPPFIAGPAWTSEGNIVEPWGRFFSAIWTAFNQESQVVSCTQATFPDLSQVHNQTFIYVSDYGHMLYWDGTKSVFAGDPPGQLILFQFPPTGPGWHLCDGSTVLYLNADGSTSSVILPVTANTYFRQ